MVDNRWLQVVQNWSVGSVEDKFAVARGLAGQLLRMFQDLVGSQNGDVEGQSMIGIKRFYWHSKQLLNGGNPVGNISE
jgi:hypothetical protein